MRADGETFVLWDRAHDKRPRYVIEIDFGASSLYVTSHTGITGLAGTLLDGYLADPSISSQRLNPDQARAEIGAGSFSIVDAGAGFTDAIRTQLDAGRGLRNKLCRFYLGYEELDWSDFKLIGTQRVSSAQYDKGRYTVQTADIQREMRQQLFDPVTTTLAQSCTATDTTIYVDDTTDFVALVHGASYSDAPGETVYYFKIGQEIIRATGKTSGTFTGCTRGVFNTTAAEHKVDSTTSQARREKVTEYIYIELPAVKLLYALLTGSLYGSADTLPANWHLGISSTYLDVADFTGIGTDIWDTSSDTAGLILRFDGLSKTDGKRFIETEILLLLGLYMPVYADGTLGLRRMVRILSDSPGVATLTEDNCVQVSALTHDMESLHNVFEVSWNWNGSEYTRPVIFLDATSQAAHGEADPLQLKFKGLHGGRYTDSTVYQMIDFLRDRYSAPPLRLSVSVLHSLNGLEVGDVVRVKLANVRDYAGVGSSLDRAFEIQSYSANHRTGAVSLELFGTTATPSVESPTTNVTALPDGFYSGAGTDLSTVIPITGGTAATGSYTLAGGATLGAAGSIWYFAGDLVIPQGCDITISGNVQLRVKGSLTLNGTINGVGGGLAGMADDTLWRIAESLPPISYPGNPGFVGNSRGYDGIMTTAWNFWHSVSATLCRSKYASFPVLALSVTGSTLSGLPADLRGTGGPPGGQVQRVLTSQETIADGAAGGDGGAGLAIICRGVSFGISGQIDLSGTDGVVPATPGTGENYVAGTGGAGGPGSLLILLDGSTVNAPDLSGVFVANTGTVAKPPATSFLDAPSVRDLDISGAPWGGYDDPARISDLSLAASCLRIQYVPAAQTAEQDAASPVPPVTAATATARTGIIDLVWTNPVDPTSYTAIEVWASTTNDRSAAVTIFSGLADRLTYAPGDTAARWFWFRVRRDQYGSDYFPNATTSTVTASAIDPAGSDGYNTATLFAYKRSASAPADNPGAVTYTFATAGWTPANGWSASIPAGTDPVWAVAATAYATTPTDSIAAGEWSSPVQVFANGSTGATGSAGTNGLNVATVYIFKRTTTDSAPALPSATATYTFGSGAISGLNNGWTANVPAFDGTNPYLWVSTATASSATSSDTIGTAEWAAAQKMAQNGADGATGAAGADGLNNALVYLFKRSASAPAVPSASSTYTFATGVLSGITNGWSQSVPAPDGNPLYVTVATASSSASTDTIGSAEWATPTIMAQDGATGATGSAGANGLNVATIFIYKRSASAPALPSVSTTYTFSTGVLTGLNNGWTQAVPAANGNPLYVSTATAASTASTDTIGSAEWASATILAQDGATGATGAAGTNGYNAATLVAYKRSASSPADNPGALTYTFATAAWTPANGWSKTIPAGTDPVWAVAATAYANTSTDSIASGDWSSPVQAFADGSTGATGAAGADGLNVATVYLYQRAASAPSVPASSLTYTFATGVLSGTLGSWSQSVPAANGNPLYVILATAASTASTDSIGTSEWTTPTIMAQDGATGATGAAGADGLTVSLSLYSLNIPCDSGGVPVSGAFDDAIGQVTVYAGATDVTASATFSSTTSNCTGSVNTATNTPVTGAKGSYRITDITTVSGYLEITVTYGGKTVKQRFTVQKAIAGASATTINDTTLLVNNTTTYSGTQGGALTLPVGPNGTISLSVFQMYGSTSDGMMAGKVQYRTTPGSGTWTDVGAEEQDAVGASSGGGPSKLNFTHTLSGPASAANWEFQYINRRYSGTQIQTQTNTGNKFAASWS